MKIILRNRDTGRLGDVIDLPDAEAMRRGPQVTKVQVRALAGVHVGDRVLQAGEVLAVDPLVASIVCATRRAELVRDADEVHLRAAVAADTERALKLAGRPWLRPEPPAPWS